MSVFKGVPDGARTRGVAPGAGALTCLVDARMRVAPHSAAAIFGFNLARALCPLGARPKPDVRNPLKQRACMPLPASRLDIRMRHPAPMKSATEFASDEVPTPRPPAFTGGSAIMGRLDGLRNSRLRDGRGGLIDLPYKVARSARRAG